MNVRVRASVRVCVRACVRARVCSVRARVCHGVCAIRVRTGRPSDCPLAAVVISAVHRHGHRGRGDRDRASDLIEAQSESRGTGTKLNILQSVLDGPNVRAGGSVLSSVGTSTRISIVLV